MLFDSLSFGMYRFSQEDVFQNKDYGQHIHERCDLLGLTAGKVKHRVADNAESDTLGNRVSEGHCENADKSRDCGQHIIPVNLCDLLHHEEANHNQSRCGRKRRNRKEDR